MIHQLQPHALIGNNHHVAPLAGEDFQMFEQDLPGENTAGFNAPGMSQLPLESCLTINGNWGYNPNDQNHKSTRELIRFLVECVGRNSNLLLNVGPRPDGAIPPEQADRLRQIGTWLQVNGEAVYGCQPLAGGSGDWGFAVRNLSTGKVFLHLLTWPRTPLRVAVADVSCARLLADGSPVTTSRGDGELVLTLPPAPPDDAAVVLALE